MIAYLDNAATTRVWPEAAQAAAEAMTERYFNPSSRYPAASGAAKGAGIRPCCRGKGVGMQSQGAYLYLLRHRE